MPSLHFPAAVFKAYDIRGIVPAQLNAQFAFRCGLALAHQARKKGVGQFVIGYDGRHSSPELAVALQQGLTRGGIECIDRKSTRLNSSHVAISYAVFCLT